MSYLDSVLGGFGDSTDPAAFSDPSAGYNVTATAPATYNESGSFLDQILGGFSSGIAQSAGVIGQAIPAYLQSNLAQMLNPNYNSAQPSYVVYQPPASTGLLGMNNTTLLLIGGAALLFLILR